MSPLVKVCPPCSRAGATCYVFVGGLQYRCRSSHVARTRYLSLPILSITQNKDGGGGGQGAMIGYDPACEASKPPAKQTTIRTSLSACNRPHAWLKNVPPPRSSPFLTLSRRADTDGLRDLLYRRCSHRWPPAWRCRCSHHGAGQSVGEYKHCMLTTCVCACACILTAYTPYTRNKIQNF